MFSALLAVALAGALPQDSTHLVVVATTDVHGRAMNWDYLADARAEGGIARVATIVDSLRARYPGHVVVTDAGNALQGDPFATYFGRIAPREPHPVIEALNLAGYDVGTPGNQDFDVGFRAMRRAFAGATFPYVSANIFAVDGDTLVYPSLVVLRRGGVRIAITGLTAPDVMGNDQLRSQVRVAPIGDVATPVLAAARGQADVVVALVHGGLEQGAAALLAPSARPDVVVVGDTRHELRDSIIDGVRFVQPGPAATQVALVHLWLVRRQERWRVERTRVDLLETSQTLPAPRVMARLAAAHAIVRDWAQTRIGEAVGAMPAAGVRVGASALTDFVNEVQRRRTGADLAATPAFSLTAGLDRGEIRRAHLFTLYPFESTVLAVRITGAQLKESLERTARYYRVDPLGRVAINDSVTGDDFDVVSGARYEIDLRGPVGSRIRGLTIGGRPVQPTDSFTLAINSRRRSGAGGYDMLRTAPVVYDRGEYVRDLLADEIARRRTIDPADYMENGWRIVPAASATAARALFGLADDTPSPPRAPQDRLVLRVLAIGDLHGQVDAAPKLKSLLDSLAAACGCADLRLDTGDGTRGGSLAHATAGRAPVEVLSRFGLAAAVLGDRELNWPRDTLRRRMAESGYPWLAANIFDTATGRRIEWTDPYRVVSAGGLRIAVIGYVTPAARELVSAELVAGLHFGHGGLPLHGLLDTVGMARPDVTILLAHGDADEAARVVGELPRGAVDLVVAGHARGAARSYGGRVPIVQTGDDGAAVVVADVVRTPAGGLEIRTRIAQLPTDIRPDTGLAPLVERLRRQTDSIVTHTVAVAKFPLDRSNGHLGQLVAEARRNSLRADGGLVTDAELQADLAAGAVTYGELLQVQPVDRVLVAVTLDSAQLLRLFEQVLGGDRPVARLSGMQVRYDPKRPPGRRVRRVVLANGRALRRGDRYRLAVDEAAIGASNLSALASGTVERSNVPDVDALAAYLRRLPQPVEISYRPGFIPITP